MHAQNNLKLLPLFFGMFYKAHLHDSSWLKCVLKSLLDLSINNGFLEGFFNWFLNLRAFLVTLITSVKGKSMLPKIHSSPF